MKFNLGICLRSVYRSYLIALAFDYFHLMKSRIMLIRPETNVLNFLHHMVFICKIFTDLYSDASQEPPSHMKF